MKKPQAKKLELKQPEPKRPYLAIAAVVIGVGVLAAWLWPSEEPAPVAPQAAMQAIPKPAVQPATAQEAAAEEKKTMRVTFINHLGDAHIKFTVDGADICTANAGQACYGDIAFGKHVVKGLEGDKVVRTLDFTLEKTNPDPKVVVCLVGAPDC